MNKSESKYYHTARLMNEALLVLLEKKDYDYISIKEVCLKAGVNRSTFYLHYESMDDLLKESVENLTSDLFDTYQKGIFEKDKLNSYSLGDLFLITPDYIIPYLSFLKEHKKIFMVAISQPIMIKINRSFDKLYYEIFDPILERYQVDKDKRKYILSFYINGLHSIIVEWIKNGCKDNINDISDLIISCITFDNLKKNKYD